MTKNRVYCTDSAECVVVEEFGCFVKGATVRVNTGSVAGITATVTGYCTAHKRVQVTGERLTMNFAARSLTRTA